MCIFILKVELKKGDISLEPNVWQGQSTIVSRLEEDIEDLQMQVTKDLHMVIMYIRMCIP